MYLWPKGVRKLFYLNISIILIHTILTNMPLSVVLTRPHPDQYFIFSLSQGIKYKCFWRLKKKKKMKWNVKHLCFGIQPILLTLSMEGEYVLLWGMPFTTTNFQGFTVHLGNMTTLALQSCGYSTGHLNRLLKIYHLE